MRPHPAQWSGFAHKDDPQAWNGYAYARNNPLVYTDLVGRNRWTRDRGRDEPGAGFPSPKSSSHSTAVAMALSMRASSSSVTSENISRLFFANLPLFCMISRMSSDARLSGMSTISLVSSKARSYF